LKNYDAAVAEIGETKTRLWLAYLGFSSIMFERNVFNLHQTLSSPRRRGPSGLPPTRADLYR
jgi:cyclopropane-fatty-acyl-phospholipid synthase